jgi:hypothetical protein
VVWAVSPDAKFLNGKFFWAHVSIRNENSYPLAELYFSMQWDVDELKAMSREIEETNKLTFGLLGAQ